MSNQGDRICPTCGKILSLSGICAACVGAQLGDNADMIGQRVGNVRIESKIATGGMAVVYLGRQELTGRKVAVKLMRPERQVSYRDREYFIREAQALGEIRHPNLVELYSAGMTAGGRHYMVLEYVPGRTLRQLVEDDGALDPLRCLRLFRQLLLALEAVHATGILHRDLKPDNLLIEPLENGRERLRLADLGLVKFTERRMRPLTGHGMTVGTPCYMAPEQVRGERLDARSDLYTTGVLMFEALTTYLPYPEEKNIDGLLDHILETAPAKLTRADPKFGRFPGLQTLLDRLMAKDADDRLPNARAVIAAMDRLLETDLEDDLKAAIAAYDGPDSGDGAGGPDNAIKNGIVVVVRTTTSAGGQEVAPPPGLLRLLRSWLDKGDVCCVHRHGATATFGMRNSAASTSILAGLPTQVERVAESFTQYSIGAGVALGDFEIDENVHPVDGSTLRKARRLAHKARPGQVLIPRSTAVALGLVAPPDASTSMPLPPDMGSSK